MQNRVELNGRTICVGNFDRCRDLYDLVLESITLASLDFRIAHYNNICEIVTEAERGYGSRIASNSDGWSALQLLDAATVSVRNLVQESQADRIEMPKETPPSDAAMEAQERLVHQGSLLRGLSITLLQAHEFERVTTAHDGATSHDIQEAINLWDVAVNGRVRPPKDAS